MIRQDHKCDSISIGAQPLQRSRRLSGLKHSASGTILHRDLVKEYRALPFEVTGLNLAQVRVAERHYNLTAVWWFIFSTVEDNIRSLFS